MTFVTDSCVLPVRSDNRESKESLERKRQCSDRVARQLGACPRIHFILLEKTISQSVITFRVIKSEYRHDTTGRVLFKPVSIHTSGYWYIIPGGVGFSSPVTLAVGPAHPLFQTVGTVAFPGIKRLWPVLPSLPAWHVIGCNLLLIYHLVCVQFPQLLRTVTFLSRAACIASMDPAILLFSDQFLYYFPSS